MAKATKAEDRDDAFDFCRVVRDAWSERIHAYRRSCIAIFLEQREQTKCPDTAAGTLEEIPTRDKAARKRCWLCHTTTSHFALRYIHKLIQIEHQETKP